MPQGNRNANIPSLAPAQREHIRLLNKRIKHWCEGALEGLIELASSGQAISAGALKRELERFEIDARNLERDLKDLAQPLEDTVQVGYDPKIGPLYSKQLVDPPANVRIALREFQTMVATVHAHPTETAILKRVKERLLKLIPHYFPAPFESAQAKSKLGRRGPRPR